jgi:hypothetical protein
MLRGGSRQNGAERECHCAGTRQQWMLNVLDEFSHECLAIRVARKLTAIDVITWTTQRGLITIVSAIG